MSPNRVVAVVVTYRPDGALLQRLLSALLPQVRAVVVVHNGDVAPALPAVPEDALQVLVLGENFGVARAQNEGIRRALDQGASHVLLFDQDSVPAADMVSLLLAAESLLTGQGCPVAALGPRYLDIRQQNPPPFIQLHGLRLRRQRCDRHQDVVAVDYLVSSGCLIPAAALRRVGPMNDALFIDYVDIEWGLRAGMAGLQSYGVCAALMEHALGESPLMILGRPRPVHTPLRHYYLFRNAIWLYRFGAVPRAWKWADGWRLLLKFFAYATFARPHLAHWQMMGRGVWDGLRGRLGPYRVGH